MKNRISLSILTIIILFSVVSSSVLAKVNTTGSAQKVLSWPASAPWTHRLIHFNYDPISDVGTYNSIAVSPYDNLPYISYYDAANKDLMLASQVKIDGGNCGNNDWWCRAVDGDGLQGRSADDVGQYSSIAFWRDNDSWKLGISYYDATVYGLRFAQWEESNQSGDWSVYTIHWGSSNYSVGMYTSLHYDSSGIPHIAYYGLNNLGNDDLWYATYVGNGTGTCSESLDWQCQVVDTGNGTGKFASLDLSWNRRVYIAYYTESTGDLKYAYYTGLGNCISGNGWSCQTIDSVNNVGGYPSIVAPGYTGDAIRVAYYDFINHQLRYAYSGMGAGYGNCGPANSWQCNMIDDMSDNLPVGISMKVDPDGYPIIAYQYRDNTTTIGREQLRIARPYLVYDDTGFGNCGDTPPGYANLYWLCSIVEVGGLDNNLANYVSLTLKPGGLALISYTDTRIFAQGNFLILAYQINPLLFLPIINK